MAEEILYGIKYAVRKDLHKRKDVDLVDFEALKLENEEEQIEQFIQLAKKAVFGEYSNHLISEDALNKQYPEWADYKFPPELGYVIEMAAVIGYTGQGEATKLSSYLFTSLDRFVQIEGTDMVQRVIVETNHDPES